jgi:light-regulated signal transduction histidine kinase (bacteriophytochrome)
VSELGPQILDRQRNWLVSIERAAKHMAQLIDDLMRLSRLGRQALEREDVDMAPLVHDVIDEQRRQLPQRELTVHVGDLPRVAADLSLLRQVFVNLLSNAFKFTRDTDQAVIHVGCEQRTTERVFFVRDNGSGFDMAHASQLFNAFHRLHLLDQYEGSGVGLSMVKRIVQRHNGRVWAEASPGQGASFFFTLGPTSELHVAGGLNL